MKNNNKTSSNQTFLLPSEPPPLPREVIMLPLQERPVFPGLTAPIVFQGEAHERGLREAVEKRQGFIGLTLLKEERKVEKGFFSVGCVGRILRVNLVSNQELQVVTQCLRKFKLQKIIRHAPFTVARVEYTNDKKNLSELELKGYIASLIAKIKELIKLNALFSEELKLLTSKYSPEEPQPLLDIVSSMLTDLSREERQALIEIDNLKDKFVKVLHYLHKEVEISQVKSSVSKKIESEINAQQKEFFLRQQLKHIQKELGISKDEKTLAVERLEKKLQTLALSETAKKAAAEELERLKLYDPKAAEYSVSKNYLDWLLALPWGKSSAAPITIAAAEKKLNENHYGLVEVKERLLEFIAVQLLKKKTGGSILAFLGPPGTGKTSLGKSIASALGRKFYRFSLGGMRDEAEIKGHRRTYVGARPGKLLQALKQTQTMNPVLMLDEIDKLGQSYQGDPAAALLEVLDPEQNQSFLDHYLDVPFDLSKILFITTANSLETIPAPLQDRMEIIFFSGYLNEEKKHIAQRYLVRRACDKTGLAKKEVTIPAATLQEIIHSYAPEAGVRGLEKQIQTLFRKKALEKTRGKKDYTAPITTEQLPTYLGEKKFQEDEFFAATAGVVSGLAWTALGGAILQTEAIVTQRFSPPNFPPESDKAVESGGASRGSLKLTGQLGGVMQESAQLAYSYVKKLAGELPKTSLKDPTFFQRAQLHLHVPAGAIPKDGPSAGITMATALLSLATGKRVSKKVAMTGELTLSGLVLPIGGIKEKLIAAKRNQKKVIFLPAANQTAVARLPKNLVKGLELHYVKHFDAIINALFA